MQQLANGSVATQNDPIWHRLRVERICYLLLGILWFASIMITIVGLWQTSHTLFVWIYGFYLLVFIKTVIDRFRWPAYWQRIGQRRDEALHGAEIPATPFQPERTEGRLPVPTSFSLCLNKTILTLGKICLGLVVVLWIVLAALLVVRPGINNDNWFLLMLAISVLLAGILIIYTFRYLVFTRYYMQRISMTEDGLRVYYLRQERFMRWDEMRVFTSYGAQGVAKSNQVRAYEVANEQIVIRWSQLSPVNMFFAVQSSLDRDEDWNWLVSRLNTYIAERTGLALLDLGDKAAKRSGWPMPSPLTIPQTFTPRQESRGANVLAPAAESVITPLAQNDTLVERLQWDGDLGKVFKFLGGTSLVLIVVGVLSFLPATEHALASLSAIWGNAFIFVIGVLLLLLTLLLGMSTRRAHKYWSRIQALRLRAFLHVQSSALPDVTEVAPLPQPTKIRVSVKQLFMAVISFLVTFTILFLLFYFLLHTRDLLFVLIPSLVLAFFSGLLQIPLAHKASIQRIEVTENGLATYMNGLDNYIRWEDVRLFSRYRTLATFSRKGGSTLTYELAGEKTVVRMLGIAKNWSMYASQPKMERAQFVDWQAQLNAYIEQRTRLTLIDLDNLNQSNDA